MDSNAGCITGGKTPWRKWGRKKLPENPPRVEQEMKKKETLRCFSSMDIHCPGPVIRTQERKKEQADFLPSYSFQ